MRPTVYRAVLLFNWKLFWFMRLTVHWVLLLVQKSLMLTLIVAGLQDAINKTHSTVLSELQRQFETKERLVRAQLLSLGSALPVLQTHLMLCTAFTSGSTKYQFLEMAHFMLERLSRVAQLGHPPRPPLLTTHPKVNFRNEFARVLQPYVSQTAPLPKETFYEPNHFIGRIEQFTQVCQKVLILWIIWARPYIHLFYWNFFSKLRLTIGDYLI